MSIAEEYKIIYNKEVFQEFKNDVKIYKEEKGINRYQPLSHNCGNLCNNCCNHDCYKSLGKLLRKNVIFYCYGEGEIVEKYKSNQFSDLEKATLYAYKSRLPQRQPNQDGLLGEVLIDAIIQTIEPDAYKLAVRTIFRQNDNNEIKGYDLTYFTNNNGKITLWLGQAKLGDKQYCKRSIAHDLDQKYKELYMAKQLYFLADKPVGITEQGKEIANLLNEINLLNINASDEIRSAKLLDFLNTRNIGICIPCLLAYESKEVYGNSNTLNAKIDLEIAWAKKWFDKVFSNIKVKSTIVFYVFPLDDVISLRGDKGFYDGLR